MLEKMCICGIPYELHPGKTLHIPTVNINAK
jgi:hypothetical protein